VQEQGDWRRYVAPAAFLLAVTIAVVLVRAGLEQGTSAPVSATAPSVGGGTTSGSSAATTTTEHRPTKRYWIVRAGDTFGVIAGKTGVSVATLQRLNPKISSTSLFIGEKVRLR